MKVNPNKNDLDEVIKQYDDLFPKVDDPDINELFRMIKIYFARYDGLIDDSNILLGPKRSSIVVFNPIDAPLDETLYEGLKTRLSVIRKYKITSPDRILRLIRTSFYSTNKLTVPEHKFLRVIVKNPRMSFVEVSDKLKMKRSLVTYYYKKLHKSILLRYSGYIDFTRFKLNKYLIIAEVPADIGAINISKKLSTPFTKSMNADTATSGQSQWIWASYLIPAYPKYENEFKKSITKILDEYTSNHFITEVISGAYSANLDLYDTEGWIFPDGSWPYGLFNMVQENKENFELPNLFEHSNDPVYFDRKEFLISMLLSHDLKISRSKLLEALKAKGIKISEPTLSRLIYKLLNNEIIYPYVSFSGLGLEELVLVDIRGADEEEQDILLRGLAQFPMFFGAIYIDGLTAFIKVPFGSVGRFLYLFEGMRDDHIITIFHRLYNLGSKLPYDFVDYWDEDKQRWTFPKDYFVLKDE